MILTILILSSTINFRVTKIDIQGNEYFKDSAIKKMMLTRTTRFFYRGIFIKEIFDGDITAIKNLYNYNGFLEAQAAYRLDFDSTKKAVKIGITIEEGNQTFIKEIDFAGNTKFSNDLLREKINTKLTQPFDRRKIDIDNYIITSIYDDLGYADVKVQSDFVADNFEAKIVHNIIEGEEQFIEAIAITGLQKTKKQVVLREINLGSNSLFRYANVLKSQRNLYDLGIFKSIRTQTKNGSKPNFKVVLFTLSEKEPITVNLRIGYGTYDYLRFGLGFTHINILGRAWQGKIEGKVSFSEYRLNSQITFPKFLIVPIKYSIGSFYQFKKEIGFKTRHIGLYNETHFDMINGQFSTKYDIGNIRTYLPVSEEKDSIKNEWLHGLTLNWLKDRRDDPFAPNAGDYININLETSGIIMPASVNYLRPISEFRLFKPLFPLVVASSFKIGAVQIIAPSTEVPVYKRFYCGGTTSVRGYSDWSIGPKDKNGNPSGGQVLLEISGEIRFPIYKIFGGVFFLDAGNVWQKYGDIGPGLRWGTGAGLRLKTPLGNARLDYGMKLDRKPAESTGALHFAIGEAF